MRNEYTANHPLDLQIAISSCFEAIPFGFCFWRIVVTDLIFDDLKNELLQARVEWFGQCGHLLLLFVILLKRYRYLPEGMDDAGQTVLAQCELWTDNEMNA